MKLVLDNSALSTLSCRRKFQLTVLDGLTGPPDEFSAFGSTFHKAAEYLKHNPDAQVNVAIDSALEETSYFPESKKIQLITAVTLARQTGQFKKNFGTTKDNQKLIEFKFKFPYGTYLTPSGEEILIELAGTIDDISWTDNNILVFEDIKTAADFKDESRKRKIAEYDMAFQLPFYVFCMLKSGILPAEYMEAIRNRRYHCQYFFVFYNAAPPVFKRQIYEPFSEDFLYREIPRIINSKIRTLIEVAELRNEPAPHDGMTVYNACKYCAFRIACMHMGTEIEVDYLSRFDRRIYDPLTFR